MSAVKVDRRRSPSSDDRRAVRRGGRREGDTKKKVWYRKQTVWLTAVSLLYIGWRKLRGGRLQTQERSA
jgi:hypothetical protein